MYQSRSMCEDCRKKRRSRLKIALRKKWAFLRRIRNRCKRFGVAYDPAVKSSMVFERDSFACQICRKQCLKKFRWIKGMPHPLSPTVDHITPLSWRIRGHTWDNVQCACWSCNVHKSNKSGGQLAVRDRPAGMAARRAHARGVADHEPASPADAGRVLRRVRRHGAGRRRAPRAGRHAGGRER
ncbi:MAG: HNH endonuclease [Caulobacteraceae bacterium]|nr:HNH endonuclease [Caulobacteraceae bacterium]